MATQPVVWFITGCSSGFGRLTAERVLSEGGLVVATARTTADLSSLAALHPPSRLLTHKLDVTVPSDIAAAFAAAHAAFGRIDVVLNNAGYALLGEVEGTPDGAARAVFETNFWGAAGVSREAVRFMREVNGEGRGGRVLVVSSFTGLKPLPCSGYYSASKHALEALTDALAHELDPSWNIKITLIEPGTFATAALTNAVILPPSPAYTAPTVPAALIRASLSTLGNGERRLGDPHKAVAKICAVAALEAPPMRLVLGMDAVGCVREQMEGVRGDVEGYVGWSADLLLDS